MYAPGAGRASPWRWREAFGPVDLGLDVLATGERKDFGFPQPVTLDSYVLANLTARWQATRALSLVARLENALNEQYELASTFNTPDRGLYVSVRYAPGTGGPGNCGVAHERRCDIEGTLLGLTRRRR